jgi:hypothetical protein
MSRIPPDSLVNEFASVFRYAFKDHFFIICGCLADKSYNPQNDKYRECYVISNSVLSRVIAFINQNNWKLNGNDPNGLETPDTEPGKLAYLKNIESLILLILLNSEQ